MVTPNTLKAEVRAAELQRQARAPRPPLPEPASAPAELELSVRRARESDGEALTRLAQLDCAAVPSGRVLIGAVGSRPAAALSLDDGAVVADPFTPTAELVQLLKIRARQLEQPRGHVRRVVYGPLVSLRRTLALRG